MTNMRKAARVFTAAVLVPSAVLASANVASAAGTGKINVSLSSVADGTAVQLLDGTGQQIGSSTVTGGKASLDYTTKSTTDKETFKVKVGDATMTLGSATCKGTSGSGTGTLPTSGAMPSETMQSVTPTSVALPTSGTAAPTSTGATTGTDAPTSTGATTSGTEAPTSTTAPTSSPAAAAAGDVNAKAKVAGDELVKAVQERQGQVAAGVPAAAAGVPDLSSLTSILGPVISGAIKDPNGILSILKPIIEPIKSVINMIPGGASIIKGLIPLIPGLPAGVAPIISQVLDTLLSDTPTTSGATTSGAPTSGAPTTGAQTSGAPTANPVGNTSAVASSYDIPVTVNGGEFSFTMTAGDTADCTGVLAAGNTSATDDSSTSSTSSSSVPTSSAAPVASNSGANYGPKVNTGGEVEKSAWDKFVAFFQ